MDPKNVIDYLKVCGFVFLDPLTFLWLSIKILCFRWVRLICVRHVYLHGRLIIINILLFMIGLLIVLNGHNGPSLQLLDLSKMLLLLTSHRWNYFIHHLLIVKQLSQFLIEILIKYGYY